MAPPAAGIHSGTTRPHVDVLLVTYNSARWLPGLLESLRDARYPPDRLRLVVVDNASRDDSVALVRRTAAELPFSTTVIEPGGNGGFTGGYATAFAHATGAYYFVLNPDTRVDPDAIARLVAVLEHDPAAGVAEARQIPRELEKYHDPATGETSWASGACMLVRAAALRAVGGFDPTFFMYCEDVDLSWRMWLHGWKCRYVRDAVVAHFGGGPGDRSRLTHYYTKRNGALMRVIYGSVPEIAAHYAAMLSYAFLSARPLWRRWCTLRAAIASLRLWPHAWRKRAALAPLSCPQWVFFTGKHYGPHPSAPARGAQRTDRRSRRPPAAA